MLVLFVCLFSVSNCNLAGEKAVSLKKNYSHRPALTINWVSKFMLPYFRYYGNLKLEIIIKMGSLIVALLCWGGWRGHQ